MSCSSVSVAIDGYHFGRPQRSPLFHVTCSSTEPILYACHSEIDQCDPIDSAGVICEGMSTARAIHGHDLCLVVQ